MALVAKIQQREPAAIEQRAAGKKKEAKGDTWDP
jgi:hypothetical protein